MIMRLVALLPVGLVLFAAACGLTENPNAKEGSLLPAGSTCTSGKDCPLGQGCADDGLCHNDGECANDSDCTSGHHCYEGQIASGAGICSSERPSADPYCRSDGHGACRSKCTSSPECGLTNSCVGGYCHLSDECVTAADCGPNDVCSPRTDDPQYGFNECVPAANPTCVNDPAGVCRLRCQSSDDCHNGGGCSADHFCHASNECHVNTDCTTGLICYPDTQFGGLCGPTR